MTIVILPNIITFTQDFSLTKWYSSIGAPIGTQLSALNAAKLLEKLGIAKYMQDVPCQRSSSLYSPAVNGWKKGDLYLIHLNLIDKTVSKYYLRNFFFFKTKKQWLKHTSKSYTYLLTVELIISKNVND